MLEDFEIPEYQKTNREKRLTPKTDGMFWCWKCDRDVVGNGQKCKTCGTLNGTKTLKKDYSIP